MKDIKENLIYEFQDPMETAYDWICDYKGNDPVKVFIEQLLAGIKEGLESNSKNEADWKKFAEYLKKY